MVIKKIINFLKRPEVKLIIILFLITRIVLSFIGISSRIILDSYNVNIHNFEYSDNILLSIWGVWDTGYYLDIVENGYSTELGDSEMTINQGNMVSDLLIIVLALLQGFLIVFWTNGLHLIV